MNINLEKAKVFMRKLAKDHVSEYAAECAYFAILSFIPFVIFFLTLIQFTELDRESIYFWIRTLIPSTMNILIIDIINEVYLKSVGTISATIIFALWSASQGFYYLSKGLRTIYKTKKEKISLLMRLEGILYTVAFVIMIIFFLLIMFFGKRIHLMFVENFPNFSFITEYILKVRCIALIIGMFCIFLIIYKFVAKSKTKITEQIYGAIFASVAIYVISWGFSLYVNFSGNITNIYGSLTSIILMMMWVYICMYIILLGAEINVIIREYKYKLLF